MEATGIAILQKLDESSIAREKRGPGRWEVASATVRAVQIVNESGPSDALSLVEVPEPEPTHMLAPGEGVVVDVKAAGVSFPEVLQTRGQYQLRPSLPF